jgi:transcriptional regulator GlxA family with amidase domain
MRIAFVVYPGFTALDLVGPYEVLSRWPGAETRFLATQTGPVRADMGLTVVPTDTPATLPDPDMVVMPGASDPLEVLKDDALIDWCRKVEPGATWMASACTGSSVYAHAGLLDGRRTTTHWAFRDNLAAMGPTVLTNRVVFDGKFVSGAGVSAGIDMAIALTAREHGEKLAKALQLGIEYDPEPQFDAGDPERVAPSTLGLAMRVMLRDQPGLVWRSAKHLLRARVRRRAT